MDGQSLLDQDLCLIQVSGVGQDDAELVQAGGQVGGTGGGSLVDLDGSFEESFGTVQVSQATAGCTRPHQVAAQFRTARRQLFMDLQGSLEGFHGFLVEPAHIGDHPPQEQTVGLCKAARCTPLADLQSSFMGPGRYSSLATRGRDYIVEDGDIMHFLHKG